MIVMDQIFGDFARVVALNFCHIFTLRQSDICWWQVLFWGLQIITEKGQKGTEDDLICFWHRRSIIWSMHRIFNKSLKHYTCPDFQELTDSYRYRFPLFGPILPMFLSNVSWGLILSDTNWFWLARDYYINFLPCLGSLYCKSSGTIITLRHFICLWNHVLRDTTQRTTLSNNT